MREIKDLNKWKTVPCLWIGKINTIKYQFSPIYTQRQCNTNHKHSRVFWGKHQAHSKIYIAMQRTWNTKPILRRNKVKELILLNFETYYKESI